MKNRKIIFLSLGLLLIVTTLVISISAWLTDTDEIDGSTFTVGDVSYTLNGNFIPSAIVVPGQPLLAEEFTLTNNSTVSSELRILVDYTFRKEDANNPGTWIDVEVSSGLNGLLSISETPQESGGFSLHIDWKENLEGQPAGYWYYSPSSGTEIPAESQNIPILSNLMLDGSKVGNTYSKHRLYIKFTFQAKQKEYVTWENLGSIDFSTGLA